MLWRGDIRQKHQWGGGLYVKAPGGLDLHQAPAKRVWFISKATGGGIMSKLQRDLEKCDEIQTASSAQIKKLKNTLSISEHSFE